MKNKIKLSGVLKMLVLTVCAIFICALTVRAQDTDVYYSNDLGLELTEQEYEYATQYVEDVELDFFTQDELDYLLSDVERNVVGSENTVLIESANDYGMMYSLNSLSKWTAIHTTSMKNLTMSAYFVSGRIVKYTLVCEWSSIPSVKSYDVIGFRIVGNDAAIYKMSNGGNDIAGIQNYDGNFIKYNGNSNNLKIENGVGLSCNIVDSVSEYLTISLATNIVLGDRDYVGVYGSYQHATSNVTLEQSQKYNFSYSGMGHVFEFASSVASIYDNTQGLYILATLTDN